MPLFVSGEIQHLRELNSLNDAIATASDISFGVREEPTAEEIAAHNKESKRKLSGVSANYHGETYIYYDRLDLESAFANQLISVEFVAPMTTLYDQLATLNEKLSTIFTTADIEDFTFDPGLTEGILSLNAKPNHPFWKGGVLIAYSVTTVAPIAIPDVYLDGVMTPNASIAEEQAALRYAAYNFMDHATWFEALPLDVLDATAKDYLRDALTAMDSSAWVSTGVAPYSLQGVKLLYTGDDVAWIVNRQYPYVAVFELTDSSTVSKGRLYLHYTK